MTGAAKLCFASPFICTSQKKTNDLESRSSQMRCHIVPDYRTFIDDYLKILDFIEWLKVAYPEKAAFITKK